MPGRCARWPIRAGLVTLAAIAVLVGAVLLGGPELLDLPAVKSKAQRKVSRVVDGDIAWDALQIRLLLMPHVEMRGVTIDVPGQAHARIEHVEARLRLRSLLHGQVEVTSLAVLRPVIRIEILPSAPSQSEPTADPLALYRSLIGPLLQAVRDAAPEATLEISEGNLELRAPGMPHIQARGLSLRARTDASGVNVETSAASDLWDYLNFQGRVELADLSGQFGLELVNLKPQAWLNGALSGATLGIDIPRADLRAQLRTDARTSLRCDFRLDVASLQVARSGHRLAISDVALKGAAILRPHDGEVTLNELRAGSLVPAARAALRFTGDAGKPQASLDIPRLDLNALRDAVVPMAADSAQVRRYLPRILGGEIMDLRLRAEADTWRELLRPGHLDGSATLAHASIMLPVIEQHATALGGQIELSDAKVELAAASARVGLSDLTDARLRFSLHDGAASASIGFDLDLPQALAIAGSALSHKQASPLDDVESAAGRLQGRVNVASMSTNWNASVDITRSNALVRLRALPWPVSLHAAQASISPMHVSISGLQGTIGRSSVADLGATFALEPELRIESGSGHATLALEEIYPWLRSHAHSSELPRDVDSISGSLQITLNSLSGALSQPSSLAYDATMRPDKIGVDMRQLPGRLTITGGAVHIDPNAVKVDRVEAEMLDARGLVSGEISDYRGTGLQMRMNIADAVMGDKSAHWIRQRLGVPAQFEPRTPLHVAVQSATWSPNQGVDAQGSVTFEAGPELTADVRWEPGALDIRRLVIRDRANLATFGLRIKDHLLKARFSGSIFAQSIAAMFRRAGTYQGQATGDLDVTLDLERRGRSSAQGHLTAEALDIDELLPTQVAAQARVNRLELSADGPGVWIHNAEVSWAHQLATISGRIARADKGLLVDLQLDSPGIQIGALLHRGATADQDGSGEEQSAGTHGAEFFPRVWSVPITGQIQLRSTFVQFQRYRLAPVTAVLTLSEDQAELRLHETQLCGLSFPLTLQIVPEGFTASARIQARRQQLEQVARCLSDERLLLTGEFDARANLTAKGTFAESLNTLEGTVQLESRNGYVKKFALIGNILAMTHIVDSFDRGASERPAEGFPYRNLVLEGHFSQGRFVVEDLIFDSSAFGLAAVGSIGLADREAQLTVLVAPFSRLDNLVRKAPIIGYLVGGTLTSVPVDVRGDIRDPTVVPLDPRAIASGLTALYTRALKVPERMLAPLRPGPGSTAPSTAR